MLFSETGRVFVAFTMNNRRFLTLKAALLHILTEGPWGPSPGIQEGGSTETRITGNNTPPTPPPPRNSFCRISCHLSLFLIVLRRWGQPL